MSEDHHVTIDGKRWLLRFTKLKGDAAGWTFFDNAKRPRILIDERLRGGARLETIVHELLHFSVPNHGKLWKSLMHVHLGDYPRFEKRLRRASVSSQDQ